MLVICLRNMFTRPHSEDVSYQLLGCKDAIRVILICADARPRISFLCLSPSSQTSHSDARLQPHYLSCMRPHIPMAVAVITVFGAVSVRRSAVSTLP